MKFFAEANQEKIKIPTYVSNVTNVVNKYC